MLVRTKCKSYLELMPRKERTFVFVMKEKWKEREENEGVVEKKRQYE